MMIGIVIPINPRSGGNDLAIYRMLLEGLAPKFNLSIHTSLLYERLAHIRAQLGVYRYILLVPEFL